MHTNNEISNYTVYTFFRVYFNVQLPLPTTSTTIAFGSNTKIYI